MAGARTNKRSYERAEEAMNRRIASSATAAPPARTTLGSGPLFIAPSGRPMAGTPEDAQSPPPKAIVVTEGAPKAIVVKEPEAKTVDMGRAAMLFAKTHGGPFNPKSSMDKKKMAAITNLLSQEGSDKLTPNQFALQIYRTTK